MIDHLQTRLKELKLTAMAGALQTQLDQVSTYEPLTFIERLTLLLDHESHEREQRRQDRLIRQAHFKLRANVQDIDYAHKRNITQSQIAQLAQSQWVVRAQNLLVTGACGTGKTWLCCALGHSACLNGLSVRYYRLSRLLLELTQARADGSYTRQLKALAKTRVLIIDDWGLEALSATHRNDLLEIMDDRHGNASTMVISQLPTDQWHASIGDNTLADAILDRLMHNAHRLTLKGESMRKAKEKLTEDEQLM